MLLPELQESREPLLPVPPELRRPVPRRLELKGPQLLVLREQREQREQRGLRGLRGPVLPQLLVLREPQEPRELPVLRESRTQARPDHL